MKKNTKILITGGAGFVGSHLSKYLINKGYKVTILDNFSRGVKQNLKNLNDKYFLENRNLNNSKKLKNFLNKFDVIFHLAAINGTEYFYKIPDKVLDNNISITLNIIKNLDKKTCKKFIFFSSSEVYQKPSQIPTPENTEMIIPDITNPRYSYGISKIVGEAYCNYYLKQKKIPFTIIRPHNFYGPNMGFKHVIPQFFIKAFNKKGYFEIQGKGNETRSFCYIDDAIEVIVKLCFSRISKNQIVHIGNNTETSIYKLAKKILKITNQNKKLKFSRLKTGSVKRRVPSLNFYKKIKFKNKINLDEGLKKTLDWFNKNKNLIQKDNLS